MSPRVTNMTATMYFSTYLLFPTVTFFLSFFLFSELVSRICSHGILKAAVSVKLAQQAFTAYCDIVLLTCLHVSTN